MNKIIKKHSSKEVEICDLDLLYPYYGDGVNYDPDGEDRNEVLNDFDTYPAEINDVIKILKGFKKSGYTHVYMWEHVDHHGYEFAGAYFEDMTKAYLEEQEELERHKEEVKRKNDLAFLVELKAKYES